MDSATLSRGIHALYDGLLRDDAPTHALDVLRDQIGAEHAILMRIAPSSISRLATCRHLSTIAQAQLDNVAVSPENQFMLAALGQGRSLRTTDVITRQQVLGSAAYQETLRPIDGGLAAYGVVADGRDQLLAIVCRSAARGIDFDDAALRHFNLLLPHLVSVCSLARRMGLRRECARTGFDALDCLADGIAVLAGDGSVVHSNPAAESLLSQGDRIRRSAATIMATDPRDDRLLQSAFRTARELGSAAAARDAVEHAAQPLQVMVGRRASAWPLVVTLLPVRAPSGLVRDERSIVVHIVDTARVQTAAPDPALLRALFELTPKEAGLAAALATGLTLRQAAAQQGVHFSTARTHLEHIFQKTVTHHQTQLVVLLKSVQSPVSTGIGQVSSSAVPG